MPIEAGATYMVTRRCTQGKCFFPPTEYVSNIAAYALGIGQLYSGVELHAFCFNTNHWHGVLTDPRAMLPRFMEQTNGTIGRVLNWHFGRSEILFRRERFQRARLLDHATVLAQAIYTQSNPVKDQLVESMSEWPGLSSHGVSEDPSTWWSFVAGVEISAAQREYTITVRKPPRFFSKRMPDEVEIRLTVPALFEGEPKEYWESVARGCHEVAEEARDERQRNGHRVMGLKRILARDPETPLRSPRADRIPRFVVMGICGAMRDELKERIRRFRELYRIARKSFTSGDRLVEFPYGTYKMRVELGVACESAPP